jgi:regulatory protein
MRETGKESEPKRTKTPATALSHAVKLLSAQPYSARKLREKLTGKFPRDEVDRALRRLQDERLLDDRHYAEDFVRARIVARPRSGFILMRELTQRGVARALAKEVVDRLVPRDDDEGLARELLSRKQTMYRGLDEPTRRRRLIAFLARRGFSYEVIQKVLKIPPEAESDANETLDKT